MKLKRGTARMIAGCWVAGLLCGSATMGSPLVEPDTRSEANVVFWLETSLKRVYPTSGPSSRTSLSLIAARNSTISFQVCLRNQGDGSVTAACSIEGEDGLSTRIRRVGYIPISHHTTDVPPWELDGVGRIPGLVPDPLFPEASATVGAGRSQSFWVTLGVPGDISPGVRNLRIRVDCSGLAQPPDLTARVEVFPFTIQPRRDFPVTHWWRAESIYHYYRIEPWGEEWWRLTRAYVENLIAHGTNVIFVPSFFMRRETFQQPAQMVKVTYTGGEHYDFDFSRVRRFVRMARECGAEYFEWPHFWIYWGVKHPVPVYEELSGGEYRLLWPIDLDGFSYTYQNYLRQYLPRFHEFLVEEGILDNSFFHLSDEPGGAIDNYRRAREILRTYAPWMKVMDALSDIQYGREGITDMPIPIVDAAQAYIDEGIPHWVYFCCGPRGYWLNRFCDTPLTKVRMSGWLFYRLGARGFLHWGYNYWYRMETEEILDPFVQTDGGSWPGIPNGDPLQVYPGADGPLDSIRWEVFAESLQDYAILQTAGISPDDPLLSPIKSYAGFPRDEQWIQDALRGIIASEWCGWLVR